MVQKMSDRQGIAISCSLKSVANGEISFLVKAYTCYYVFFGCFKGGDITFPPFRFRGQDFGSDCASSWSLLTFP